MGLWVWGLGLTKREKERKKELSSGFKYSYSDLIPEKTTSTIKEVSICLLFAMLQTGPTTKKLIM